MICDTLHKRLHLRHVDVGLCNSNLCSDICLELCTATNVFASDGCAPAVDTTQSNATVCDTRQETFPKVCRNPDQFAAWQKSRHWLSFDATTGSVKCTVCAQVKYLGLHTESGQHNERAFVDGTVQCKDAKTLLKKLHKHRDSRSHKKCQDILKQREANDIVHAAEAAATKFVERNKENIDVTAKVFRTAYECAKSHLPCTEHSRLVELQSLNAINCGHILYSNHACSNIVGHIAGEMRAEIVQHIVTSQSKLSILVDESTSVSNVQSMVVYIRMMFDGEICTYFLGLVPVTEKQLLLALRQHL